MLEKIKHINPKEITDLAQLQNLMVVFMNVLESQAKRIDDLDKENQELKNEINRLKGEHGDLPPRAPKSAAPKEEKPKKKPKKKNNKQGPKNQKIEIDNTVKCEIDKSVLPNDAKFHGYREVIQQDIIFKRNNTLFKIPLYYSKRERRLYCGELPAEYEGEFGGQLKSCYSRSVEKINGQFKNPNFNRHHQ
jgi:regulator of replication initiation timing